MKNNMTLPINDTYDGIGNFLKNTGYLKITFTISFIAICIVAIILISRHTKQETKESTKENNINFSSAFDIKNLTIYKTVHLITEAAWRIISSFMYLNGKRDEESKKRKRYNERKNREINNYLEEEYVSAKKTRGVFINLFFISTISIIIGFLWIKNIDQETRIVAGLLYFGLSLFVLFIIKSCYSRTAVIISILEDQDKKNDLANFLIKYKKDKDLNENDIELIKEIRTSRSERERAVKHPYEIILKNLSDSKLEIDNNKIKIDKK